ncbi:MAG: AraC family transcriptional regulator [Planctomycetota bacterium]|nr:AraC family transcriptional regulator [Planctomycetota bacterium]
MRSKSFTKGDNTTVHAVWDKGITIMRGRKMQRTMEMHSHSTYQIGVVVEGVGRHWYRHEDRTIGAGQSLSLHPGELHDGGPACASGWSWYFLYIDPASMQRSLGDGERARPTELYFAEYVLNDRVTYDHLLIACRAIHDGEPLLMQQSALMAACRTLRERHANESVASRKRCADVRRAAAMRDYLDANFMLDAPLESLARVGGCSPAYACRVFSAAWGLAPHQYQIVRRVLRAREFVAQGRPVDTVARAVGFCDQAHLTRHFRRVLGVPPAHYARKFVQEVVG